MIRFLSRLLTGLAVIGQWVSASAQELPSREELLNPAPNPAWNRFNPANVEVKELYPGFYTFHAYGTRNIFMVTDEGVIATDPVNEMTAKLYLAEIRKITDKPIKYLVYSHDHWDHVEGGQIFKDEGAEIIAHEKCVPSFFDTPNPKITLPDTTIAGNHTIELGGRTLELLYYGTNHSNCMLIMRPDNHEYLFIVDLVTPGGAPLGTLADYYPHHMIRTLKEIERLDFKYMIGGHGVWIADRSAVTERREYFEDLMRIVGEEAGVNASNPLS